MCGGLPTFLIFTFRKIEMFPETLLKCAHSFARFLVYSLLFSSFLFFFSLSPVSHFPTFLPFLALFYPPKGGEGAQLPLSPPPSPESATAFRKIKDSKGKSLISRLTQIHSFKYVTFQRYDPLWMYFYFHVRRTN